MRILIGLLLAIQFIFSAATAIRGGHVFIFLALFCVTDVAMLLYLFSDRPQVKGLVWSFFSVSSCCINVHFADISDVSEYYNWIIYDRQILIPIMFCAFYFLFQFIYSNTLELRANPESRKYISALSVLLSIFSLLGYSYQETDSWELVFANSTQVSKSYIVFLGLFFTFYYIIAWIYSIADKYLEKSESGSFSYRLISGYLSLLRAKPFWIAFLTMTVFELPYMITAYPGIFAGDTIDQLLQAFQIPYNSAESINLITQEQLINQHHSVLHTMYMHYMLCVGVKVFHSANIGIFLITISQTLLTIFAISYLIKTVVSEKVSDIHLLLLMVYFVISPRIQNMLFVLSKDVPYGAFTLISLILFWKVLTGRQCGKNTYCAYVICMIILQLLRKEAIYINIIQMIVLFIACRSKWKQWSGVILANATVFLALGRIIFPAFSISPSLVNEALSIPIQQTARYIQEYPVDISDAERDAINGMWDYEELKDNYDPNRSDVAKDTFKRKSVKSDWVEYFKAWGTMLLKHPTVYVQATLNNYYEYVFPGRELAEAHTFERREWDIDYLNEKLGDRGIFVYYPKVLDNERNLWETAREKVFSLPILSLFLSVAIYTWILLGSFVYWIYRKTRDSVMLFVPLLLILLVCLAGPCNGAYFRYFYPIVLCLPASMSFAWITARLE